MVLSSWLALHQDFFVRARTSVVFKQQIAQQIEPSSLALTLHRICVFIHAQLQSRDALSACTLCMADGEGESSGCFSI